LAAGHQAGRVPRDAGGQRHRFPCRPRAALRRGAGAHHSTPFLSLSQPISLSLLPSPTSVVACSLQANAGVSKVGHRHRLLKAAADAKAEQRASLAFQPQLQLEVLCPSYSLSRSLARSLSPWVLPSLSQAKPAIACRHGHPNQTPQRLWQPAHQTPDDHRPRHANAHPFEIAPISHCPIPPPSCVQVPSKPMPSRSAPTAAVPPALLSPTPIAILAPPAESPPTRPASSKPSRPPPRKRQASWPIPSPRPATPLSGNVPCPATARVATPPTAAGSSPAACSLSLPLPRRHPPAPALGHSHTTGIQRASHPNDDRRGKPRSEPATAPAAQRRRPVRTCHRYVLPRAQPAA
jgi:hypothetical protein